LIILEAQDKRSRGGVVHLKWTVEKANEISNGTFSPSESWASKFWKKMGWYRRKATPRNEKEMRPNLSDQISDFQRRIEAQVLEESIPKENIWSMDEVGIWNGEAALHTYVDPETMDSSVIEFGNHRRDSVMMLLSSTGERKWRFIEHKNAKTKKMGKQSVILEKGISGVGLTQMNEWVDEDIEENDHPSILIMDQLASHKNKEINKKLKSKNWKRELIPPQGGKYCSPLDNSFFSVAKARLRRKDTSTTQLKKDAFGEVVESIPPEMVQNFWRKSGWFPVQNDGNIGEI
jgi:hypothetical protein